MKVVLFRSPKFLSGILRLVFGIKKESVQLHKEHLLVLFFCIKNRKNEYTLNKKAIKEKELWI